MEPDKPFRWCDGPPTWGWSSCFGRGGVWVGSFNTKYPAAAPTFEPSRTRLSKGIH